MSHKVWVVVLVLVFVVALGAAALLLRHPVAPEAQMPDPVEVNDLEGKSIYASGEYGFTFVYESRLALSEGTEQIGEGKTVSYIELRDGEDSLRFEIDADAPECATTEGAETLLINGATWLRFPFGTDTGYETSQGGACITAIMQGGSVALDDALFSISFPFPTNE